MAARLGGLARRFAGRVRFRAGFHPQVPQFGPHLPRKPDWQPFWNIKNGVRYTGMPPWEDLLGKSVDTSMWKLAGFLNHLDSLPPAVNEEWQKKPAP